jgi:hypothetical protein
LSARAGIGVRRDRIASDQFEDLVRRDDGLLCGVVEGNVR